MAVRAEHARRSELAEFVAHHGLRDEDGNVLSPVVDRDGVAHHLRDDGGATGPRTDHSLVAAAVHVLDLGHEVPVHERSLLDRSRHQPLPFPRRLRMNLLEALPFLRVRPSFFPHGVVGWRPPEDLPSPPPSGWSTGFMATPRTSGRLRSHRALPALPRATSSCSGFPTSPTTARQVASTRRISPDGSLSVAYRPSLATSCTELPADRAILAPAPGFSSTPWITVPTGMFRNGRAFPGLMSAPSPDIRRSPTAIPCGARM